LCFDDTRSSASTTPLQAAQAQYDFDACLGEDLEEFDKEDAYEPARVDAA
jgi:hypothetical protein